MDGEFCEVQKENVLISMKDKERARGNIFPLPLPAPATRNMACRARPRKKRHDQNMKQDRADQGQLKSRASKYRSGPEQTTYRAVQNG